MRLKYFLQKYSHSWVGKGTILVFLCLLSSAILAATKKPDDELSQLLNNIRTMQATFKQFIVSRTNTKVGQETIGAMILERPGKFRWEITQPNKQLIIINKNKLLLYDIDLAQVTKRKMDYRKPGNPAMLLSGNTETLKQLFKITKLKSPDRKIWFELKPKSKSATNSGYQWVRICFEQGRLTRMRILDNFDQQSEINFKNIVVNTKISGYKFKFVIPSDVDVVDEG
jgi:outer membrane lipoprotein carrier protein